MKKYTYIPHTADAGFESSGSNLNEVFVNSGLAMLNLMSKTNKVKLKFEKSFKLSAKDLKSLMYDFLDELLFILETKNLFIGEIKDLVIIEKSKSFSLSCKVLGDDYKHYDLSVHIKAPTYHDMVIEKVKNGYKARVFVDV